MAYLNPSPVKIDAAELSAAARLMNWLRLDQNAKTLQIGVFIAQAKENLATAKTKVGGFTGNDWQVALWIMDILHQGRGTYAEMTQALASGQPVAALMKIGMSKYAVRIAAVSAAVDKLEASGVMNGFKV